LFEGVLRPLLGWMFVILVICWCSVLLSIDLNSGYFYPLSTSLTISTSHIITSLGNYEITDGWSWDWWLIMRYGLNLSYISYYFIIGLISYSSKVLIKWFDINLSFYNYLLIISHFSSNQAHEMVERWQIDIENRKRRMTIMSLLGEIIISWQACHFFISFHFLYRIIWSDMSVSEINPSYLILIIHHLSLISHHIISPLPFLSLIWYLSHLFHPLLLQVSKLLDIWSSHNLPSHLSHNLPSQIEILIILLPYINHLISWWDSDMKNIYHLISYLISFLLGWIGEFINFKK